MFGVVSGEGAVTARTCYGALFLVLGAGGGGIKFRICGSQEDEEPGLDFTVLTV